VVHAIQRFKRGRRLDPRAIGRVALIVGPQATEQRHLDRQPTSLLGAQYSLPYTSAVALTRDLADPLAFADETLTDPAIRALAGRIEVRADEHRFGGAWQPAGEVVVELDGASHALIAESFPGSAAQPLDFEGAADKLRRFAVPIASEQRVDRLIELVRDLDQLDDVGRLAGLIRA
jgi:2-methylcitrate dehydratase PrpD